MAAWELRRESTSKKITFPGLASTRGPSVPAVHLAPPVSRK